MLKNISNLGKTLSKAEQKEVLGGIRPRTMCAPFPNTVFCTFPSTCQNDGSGWYCA